MLEHNRTRLCIVHLWEKSLKCIRIITALETVSPKILQRVWQEMGYRFDVCCGTGSVHIENLWKRSWNPHAFEFFVQILMNKFYLCSRISLFSFTCLIYAVTQIFTSHMTFLTHCLCVHIWTYSKCISFFPIMINLAMFWTDSYGYIFIDSIYWYKDTIVGHMVRIELITQKSLIFSLHS